MRGTDDAIAADEANDEPPQYIALGAVLNRDDRWLHLIDEEPGLAFKWDGEASSYIRFDRPDLIDPDDEAGG